METSWISLLGIPALICLARMLDVALGTLRIALVSRGHRVLAPLAGFFESLIWIVAITQVLQHLDRWIHYLAWSAGFAAGTWLGLVLEERLAFGLLAIRIITADDAGELLRALELAEYDATTFGARGLKGRVRLIFSVIRRRDQQRFLDIVCRYDPDAFISLSDVRSAREGTIRSGSARRPSVRT